MEIRKESLELQAENIIYRLPGISAGISEWDVPNRGGYGSKPKFAGLDPT